jgi:hypothetical protein
MEVAKTCKLKIFMFYLLINNIIKKIIDVFTISENYNSNNTIWNVYKPMQSDIKIINTEKELIKFVNNNENIRVVGGGMNWNGSGFSKNTIRLGKNFCNYKINYKDKTITVGSSCMICTIHNYLLENKFQLKSIGYCIHSNKSQTVGGLCGTNVHHTGKMLNPFSEHCTSIVVLHFNSSKRAVVNTYYPDDIYFKYFFGSIGTLGILMYATFKIEQLNYYKIIQTNITNTNTNNIINELKNNNGMYSLSTNRMITYKTIVLNKIEKNKILINPYDEYFDANTITPYKNPTLTNRLLRIIPIKIIFNILKIYYLIVPQQEQIVKSISHISDSGHMANPHIEIEIYVSEYDALTFINLCNKHKMYEKMLIVLRYVPRINNSLFTLTEKNMMGVEKVLFYLKTCFSYLKN